MSSGLSSAFCPVLSGPRAQHFPLWEARWGPLVGVGKSCPVCGEGFSRLPQESTPRQVHHFVSSSGPGAISKMAATGKIGSYFGMTDAPSPLVYLQKLWSHKSLISSSRLGGPLSLATSQWQKGRPEMLFTISCCPGLSWGQQSSSWEFICFGSTSSLNHKSCESGTVFPAH